MRARRGIIRRRTKGEPYTLSAGTLLRGTDRVNPTDPLPGSRNITAASFTDGGADISVAFNKAADTTPELLAALALEFKPQDVVSELANGNVGLFSVAMGIQCSLGGKTVQSRSDQLWHTSHIRAAG
jgi:hypothetical protein